MKEATDYDFLEYSAELLTSLSKMAQGRQYPTILCLLDMIVMEALFLKQSAGNISDVNINATYNLKM